MRQRPSAPAVAEATIEHRLESTSPATEAAKSTVEPAGRARHRKLEAATAASQAVVQGQIAGGGRRAQWSAAKAPVVVPVAPRQRRLQHDVVVRLNRDQWPDVGPESQLRPHSRSNVASEQNREAILGEAQVAKTSDSSGFWQKADRANSDRENLEPLIHTDKLNTSSPLLFVFTPQQQQLHQINSTSKSADHLNLADSSRVAILSANYPPQRKTATMTLSKIIKKPTKSISADGGLGSGSNSAEPPELSATAQTTASSWEMLVPRLVLLNLEVRSTSATLTWDLQFFPLAPASNSSGAGESVAAAKQLLANSSREQWPSSTTTTTDTRDSENDRRRRFAVPTRFLRHNKGNNNVRWTNVAQRQFEPEELVILDRVKREDNNSSGPRLVFKHDTIRVTPTLSSSSVSSSSPGVETAELEADTDNVTAEEFASATGDSDGPSEVLGGSESSLKGRETTSDADQMTTGLFSGRKSRAHTERFLSTSAMPTRSSTSSSHDHEDDEHDEPTSTNTNTNEPSEQFETPVLASNGASGGLQLGRLQPLRASRNRRPPMRATSSVQPATGEPPKATEADTSDGDSVFSSALTNESSPAQSDIMATSLEQTSTTTTTPTPTSTTTLPPTTMTTTTTTMMMTTTMPARTRHPQRKGNPGMLSASKRPSAVEGISEEDQISEGSERERRKAVRVHATRSSQRFSESPTIRIPAVTLNRLPTTTTTTSTSTTTTSSSTPTLAPATSQTSTESPSTSHVEQSLSPEGGQRTTESIFELPATISSATASTNAATATIITSTQSESPVIVGARTTVTTSTPTTTTTVTPETIAQTATTAATTTTTTPPPAQTTQATTFAIGNSFLDQNSGTTSVATFVAEPATKSVRIAEPPTATATTTTTASVDSANSAIEVAPTLKATPQLLLPTGGPTTPNILSTSATATKNVPASQTTTPEASAGSSTLPTGSKWLVRLRQFGSNEVDIVKVVVNNLKQLFATSSWQQQASRHISFKNLEPSSAYEICVESASPNQQISDKYQIMDANHFLKCQDSSEVELSSAASISSNSQPARSSKSSPLIVEGLGGDESKTNMVIQRMDLSATQPTGSSERLPIASAPSSNVAAGAQDSTSGPQHSTQTLKLKSLCKEFFTLPANSSERVDFGQAAIPLQSTSLASLEIGGAFNDSWPTAGDWQRNSAMAAPTMVADGTSQRGLTTEVELAGNPSTDNGSRQQVHGSSPAAPNQRHQQLARKPKSLDNALKSRIEIFEINDFENPPQQLGQFNVFEMFVSRNQQPSSARGLSQTASDNTFSTRLAGPPLSPPGFNWDTSSGGNSTKGSDGGNSSGPANSNESHLISSMMPIVGCVFAFIFIVTLANILLNTISCRSSSALARRRRLAHRRRSIGGNSGTGILGAQTARSDLNAAHKHTLGSFYSDSNHSGSSHSRIVVVGKSNDPFALTSAYFEMPVDPLLVSGTSGSSYANRIGGRISGTELSSFEPVTNSGSVNGSDGKRYSSNYLLSSAARFPLGPSFEGDEKHNADMVGLARKNYNNFINNIYNSDPDPRDSTDRLHEEIQYESPSQKRSAHRRIHHQHHHLRHYRKHHLKSNTNNKGTLARQQNEDNEAIGVANQSHLQGHSNGEDNSEQLSSKAGNTKSNNNNKRQRIRFDKINPIYNMDGLYSFSGGNGDNERDRNRTGIRLNGSSNLISFGHSNQALVSEETRLENGDEKRVSSNSSLGNNEEEADEQCSYCRVGLEFKNKQQDQGQQLTQQEDQCECDGENCGESLHFTCCLDRQQQRIHTQQQQLGRVVSKNGSLVPQPFINPSGFVEETSTDTNQVDNNDERMPEMMFGDSQPPSTIITTTPMTNSADQQQQAKQMPLSAAGLSMTMPATHSKQGQQQPMAPSPPPPNFKTAPPNSKTSSSGNGNSNNSNGSRGGKITLASVTSASSDSLDNSANSDKTNFNQRRSELASKLRLAGMGKPTA